MLAEYSLPSVRPPTRTLVGVGPTPRVTEISPLECTTLRSIDFRSLFCVKFGLMKLEISLRADEYLITVAKILPPRGANGDPPLGDEEAQVEGALRARRQRRLQVDPAGAAVEHGQLRPEAVTGCELSLLYLVVVRSASDSCRRNPL